MFIKTFENKPNLLIFVLVPTFMPTKSNLVLSTCTGTWLLIQIIVFFNIHFTFVISIYLFGLQSSKTLKSFVFKYSAKTLSDSFSCLNWPTTFAKFTANTCQQLIFVLLPSTLLWKKSHWQKLIPSKTTYCSFGVDTSYIHRRPSSVLYLVIWAFSIISVALENGSPKYECSTSKVWSGTTMIVEVILSFNLIIKATYHNPWL